MNFEIGQEWQLVNGETVTIVRLDGEFKDGEVYSLGSDMVWRDDEGYCVDKTFDEGLNFSHLYTEVDELESDFSFRLSDGELKRILADLKLSNGLFDVLEFGKQVSLATTRRLKEAVNPYPLAIDTQEHGL